MAIRINNKDYLNYEEQVLKNKKDVEDINTEISGINLKLQGKIDKSPDATRIKTFTKDDFVTDGIDKVLSITYDSVDILSYDSIIIDLQGVGVDDGGTIVVKSYMDISLQIHNSYLVTDIAGARSDESNLQVFINTPIAKEFVMIKGAIFISLMNDNGSYSDMLGYEKEITGTIISSIGSHSRCDLVIHFSNPVYMIDVEGSI